MLVKTWEKMIHIEDKRPPVTPRDAKDRPSDLKE